MSLTECPCILTINPSFNIIVTYAKIFEFKSKVSIAKDIAMVYLAASVPKLQVDNTKIKF